MDDSRSPRDPYHLTRPSIARATHAAALLTAAMLLASTAPATAQDADPSLSPAPSPSIETRPEGINAKASRKIDEVIESIPTLRRLEATAPVTYRAIDQEAARSELAALLAEEYPPELLAAEDALYKRLGLLEADEDLGELTLALLGGQVLAWYDPRTDVFTLVGDVDDFGHLESLVVAHEYVHALQDQHWDLEGTRITDKTRSDQILAQAALTEGEATAVMYDWASTKLKIGELIGVANDALGRSDTRQLKRTPPLLRRQLDFSYLDGYGFVNALRGRGDWGSVDAAWENRPLSTEQILHPDLYPREKPVEIALPDVAALLGEGWQSTYTQTLGEMQIGVLLADGKGGGDLLGIPLPYPKAAGAAGWGGDRLVSLDHTDGRWAVVWQTDWDTRTDAREFRDAAQDAMKDLAGAVAIDTTDITGGLESPVLVLVADSEDTLAAVQSALGSQT